MDVVARVTEVAFCSLVVRGRFDFAVVLADIVPFVATDLFGVAFPVFFTTAGFSPPCRDNSFSSSPCDNREYPRRPRERAKARSSLRFFLDLVDFSNVDMGKIPAGEYLQ